MSSSSSKNQTQAKYANSNLNAVFAKPTASAAAQSSTSGTINRNGMLVLSKRTTRAVSGAKVVVPKPVNLPSLKKEHAGNDPTTQLVPAGASAGWAKPEEQAPPAQPTEVRSALTAGSNWASQPRAGSGAWASTGTSSPAHGRGPSYPVDRHLNPDEYPSLAATARSNSQPQKQRPVPYEQPQDPRGWADDERAPAGSLRHGDWDDERRDWDRGSREARFEAYGPPRPGHFDDYDEHPRGGRPYDAYGPSSRSALYDYPPPPPPRRPAYERDAYERYDRPAERYDRPAERYERPAERYERPTYTSRFTDYDDGLIPPPPPPRPPARDTLPPQPPAPPPEPEEEEDPERAAFEAELRNLQAEIGKKKAEQKDGSLVRSSQPAPEPPQEQQAVPVDDAALKQSDNVAVSHRAPVVATTLVTRDAEEEERRRKHAAAEKLRALEESIAARNVPPAKPLEVEPEAKVIRADASADGARPATKAIDISEQPRQSAWGPVPKPPTTAMFGSFDEHLLEELHRTPAPQPQVAPGAQVQAQHQGGSVLQHAQQQQGPGVAGQQHFQQQMSQQPTYPQLYSAPPPAAQQQHGCGQQQLHAFVPQHAAGPQQAHEQPFDEPSRAKPWRPVEGTTPVLLTHANAPSVAGQHGGPAQKDGSSAPVYDPNSYDRRALPPSGRGRGRGELVRGRGRGGGSGYDSPAEVGEVSVGSDVSAEGGRGRGRGRGSASERGRGGRGGRGRGRGRGDESGAEEDIGGGSNTEAGDSEQIGRRGGPAFAGRQVDAAAGPSSERTSGRGQGQRRDGRGGRGAGGPAGALHADISQQGLPASGSQAQSVVASGDVRASGQDRGAAAVGRNGPQQSMMPPPQPVQQTQMQEPHIHQQVPASGGATTLAAAAADAADANSVAWGSNIATDVAARTLEDPIVPDLNLPVSLDPSPAIKPPGPLVGLGSQPFDRSIGPKAPQLAQQHPTAQSVVMAKTGISGAQVQPPHPAAAAAQHVHQPGQHTPHVQHQQDVTSKSVEVLDSGMPALPADLNLDILPPKPTGIASSLGALGAGAATSMQSQEARGPLNSGYGTFGTGTGEHAAGGASAGQGPATGGISMWSQPNALGGFSQPSSTLQQHQPSAAGLSAAMQAFYSAPTVFPSTGAMGTSSAGGSSNTGAGQAGTPLVFGQGSFAQGAFGAFPFAMPPGNQLGGLNANFMMPQPFVPTNKQPDWGPWDIGLGQNTNLAPPALGRPVDLGMPPPFIMPSMTAGGQAGTAGGTNAVGVTDGSAGAAGGFSTLPTTLLGPGLQSLSPSGFSSGPKQPGSLGHPGLKPAVQGGHGAVHQGGVQQQAMLVGSKEAVKPNLPDDIFDVKPAGQLQQQQQYQMQQQQQPSGRLPVGSMPPPVPPASGPARLGHGGTVPIAVPAQLQTGAMPGASAGPTGGGAIHVQAPVSQPTGPVPGPGVMSGGRGGRGRGDGRGGARATIVEGGRGRGFAGRGGRGGSKAEGDASVMPAPGAHSAVVGPPHSAASPLGAGVGTPVVAGSPLQMQTPALPSGIGVAQGGQGGGLPHQQQGGRGEGGRGGGRGRGAGGRGRGGRGEGGQSGAGRGGGQQSGRGGRGMSMGGDNEKS